MVKQAVPTIPYRRKRMQRTDYKKRLNMLKGRKHRVVIRKSVHHMYVQLVEYHPQGDKIVAQAHSRELTQFGIPVVNGNIPCAYLTGLLLGKRALEKGVKLAVADLGLQKTQWGTRLFATIKGVADAGVDIPLSEDCIPKQDRLEGKHIAQNKATTFTRYKDVSTVPEMVAKAKQNILQK